jgi:hypothetical protein
MSKNSTPPFWGTAAIVATTATGRGILYRPWLDQKSCKSILKRIAANCQDISDLAAAHEYAKLEAGNPRVARAEKLEFLARSARLPVRG